MLCGAICLILSSRKEIGGLGFKEQWNEPANSVSIVYKIVHTTLHVTYGRAPLHPRNADHPPRADRLASIHRPRGIHHCQSTADENNTGGDCSLRQAILAANLDTAVDACPALNGAEQLSWVVRNNNE
jgi:CSLREA domain-containing protein